MTSRVPDPPGAWRFGSVAVDEHGSTVVVEGRPIRLDRSASAILLALLRAEGELVGKDELLRTGWPGRIVQDSSLGKTIGRLRQALGPDGGLLETVHGYGYRLVKAPASATPAPAPAPPPPPPPPPQKRAPAARAWLAAAALCGLAAWLAITLIDWPGTRASAEAAAGTPRYSEPADAIGRVLWVDDHPENNEPYRPWFKDRRIGIYNATNNEDALTLLALNRYSAVISDMGRDQGREPLAGLKLLEEMRRRGDLTPFFVFSLHFTDELLHLVTEAGGQAVTDDPDVLYQWVESLFESGPDGE